ncbi:MAG: response regulator transcription factor [Bacteroidales bacterium]|nr:response regulator transcription factor [Bacteroidales bacterium]
MRAVVIEDEYAVAQMLIALLDEMHENIMVVAQLQSIEESVAWFRANPMPDIVFMDIHLADGSSFAIFDQVEITCPVVFTTAYDEYALRAFQVNSIDYLLKPIDKTDLLHAIDKFKKLTQPTDNKLLTNIISALKQTEMKFKSHFLVQTRDKLIPLAVADIAFIFTENKTVAAVTFDNRTFYLDHSLEELTELLDPQTFFRANRQFIVAHSAVKEISLWFNSKLVVILNIATPEKITVSKNRVPEFKAWFTR